MPFMPGMNVLVLVAALLASPPDVFDTLQENAWYLPVANARLYVTELGSGRPVVVLHGGPGNDFNYLVDAVRDVPGARFVLFDQRGSLLSPVPDPKTLSLSDLVADLESLRVALGEDKLVLFGHSFGTLLALQYATAHPDHVAGLVLAATVPPKVDSFAAVLGAARSRMKDLGARPEVARALHEAGAEGDKLSPRQRSARARIQLAALNLMHVERWRRMHGGGVYYSEAVDDAIGNSAPSSWDALPALAAHHIPVAVLQGDQDYLDPKASLWPRQDGIEVHVLPQAGHYSWVDAPREFQAALSGALHFVSAR